MAIHLSYNNNQLLNLFDGDGLITIWEIRLESGLNTQYIHNKTTMI